MPKHWNCFVAGCKSNYSTRIKKLKYFRIPKLLRKEYDAFFKTDCVNWEVAVICSLHWSKARQNSKHMPDIRVPNVWKDEKVRRSENGKKKRVLPYERGNKRPSNIHNRTVSRLQLQEAKLKENNEEFKVEIEELKRKIGDLTQQNAKLKAVIDLSESEKEQLRLKLSEVTLAKENAEKVLKSVKEEKKEFCWDFISDDRFKYLCGLRKEDFLTLFDCFKPFLRLLTYQGCKANEDNRRKLSKENELFACLIICRHALHLGVMAWILDISEGTMSRIFEAWMTFGHAVFSKIDLSHPKYLIQDMMPKAYKNLGYSHTVLVLDATEIKTTGFSDLKMNELFFSDYKNSHTVKALVCLTPHGTATKIPDVYPGSITDTRITDMAGALDNVLCHDGVLTDKGFTISEQLAEKGGVQNRPPMKSGNQFTVGECDANFKIACLRIHVERWIGYVRDFSILNTLWPSSRIDLLNSVWIFLAHLTNILCKVGPKE